MGARGPVPKRSSARRRRNKDSEPEHVEPLAVRVKAPAASSSWHPIAKAWYASLSKSGQARFFEPSDWQAARLVAETMTKNLAAAEPSATLFSAIWRAMGDLMTTEAQRRRLRMEIDRQLADQPACPPPAGVTALADYRASLGV